MTRALRLPGHVPVAHDITESGNTSAASIPLAMETMLTAGEAPGGGTALLIAFGAGLLYAAQVVTLPPVPACLDPCPAQPQPRHRHGAAADGGGLPRGHRPIADPVTP